MANTKKRTIPHAEFPEFKGIVPQPILNFVNWTGLRVKPQEEKLKVIQDNLASAEDMVGVGCIIGMKYAGIEDLAGMDKVRIDFHISDGDIIHPIECLIHNASSGLPLPCENFEKTIILINDSIKQARPVRVFGRYMNISKKRIFVVNRVEEPEEKGSQMTDGEFNVFMKLCDKYDLSPLEILMEMLFRPKGKEFLCYPHIKKACILYCLDPKDSTEMFHFAMITAPGEGKDFLFRKIIGRTVKQGIFEGGAASTVTALVGAMDSNNLKEVAAGLLNIHNHGRVMIGESEELNDDIWGKLLGVMSNGEYEINKGQLIGVRRESVCNLALTGNHPEWMKIDDEETDMMNSVECFGKHAKKMLSRITLVFSRVSLYAEVDTEDADVERVIMDNIISKAEDRWRTIRGDVVQKVVSGDHNNIYNFFREYLKYVSEYPVIVSRKMKERILEEWMLIQKIPGIEVVLRPISEKKRDNRKFQQFLNLCRLFDKINGRFEVTEDGIEEARDIFLLSLDTLIKLFGSGSERNLSDFEWNMVDYISQHSGQYRSNIRDGIGVRSHSDQKRFKTAMEKMLRMKVFENRNHRIYLKKELIEIYNEYGRFNEKGDKEEFKKVAKKAGGKDFVDLT